MGLRALPLWFRFYIEIAERPRHLPRQARVARLRRRHVHRARRIEILFAQDTGADGIELHSRQEKGSGSRGIPIPGR